MPLGKFQRLPSLISSWKARPSPSTAVIRIRPLSTYPHSVSLVPVHLPHRAGLEPHVHAGKLRGDGHFADRHLPSPAAGLQPIVDVGE